MGTLPVLFGELRRRTGWEPILHVKSKLADR